MDHVQLHWNFYWTARPGAHSRERLANLASKGWSQDSNSETSALSTSSHCLLCSLKCSKSPRSPAWPSSLGWPSQNLCGEHLCWSVLGPHGKSEQMCTPVASEGLRGSRQLSGNSPTTWSWSWFSPTRAVVLRGLLHLTNFLLLRHCSFLPHTTSRDPELHVVTPRFRITFIERLLHAKQWAKCFWDYSLTWSLHQSFGVNIISIPIHRWGNKAQRVSAIAQDANTGLFGI